MAMANKLVLVFAVVCAVGSKPAIAGAKFYTEVYIDLSARLAYGDLGYVRSTPDNSQEIGCYTYAYTLFGPGGWCWARSPGGTYVTCTISFSQIEGWWFWEIATMIRGDSYLQFTWDTAGYCKGITVDQASYLQPKIP